MIFFPGFHQKKLENWSIPVDQFQHLKGHFGVVFSGQSSGEVKSAVQLYKSADRMEISL